MTGGSSSSTQAAKTPKLKWSSMRKTRSRDRRHFLPLMPWPRVNPAGCFSIALVRSQNTSSLEFSPSHPFQPSSHLVRLSSHMCHSSSSLSWARDCWWIVALNPAESKCACQCCTLGGCCHPTRLSNLPAPTKTEFYAEDILNSSKVKELGDQTQFVRPLFFKPDRAYSKEYCYILAISL